MKDTKINQAQQLLQTLTYDEMTEEQENLLLNMKRKLGNERLIN